MRTYARAFSGKHRALQRADIQRKLDIILKAGRHPTESMEIPHDMSESETAAQPILPRIRRYWDGRAEGFRETRAFEFAGPLKVRWLAEIEPAYRAIAAKRNTGRLDVLDIGTGTGFLALLAATLGARAVGVDLSEEMIAAAKRTAEELSLADKTQFYVMNAQALDAFEDAQFDLIVSRNLVWTLPDPKAAYREWLRLLRPGGKLLVFDADYGAVSFTDLTAELEADGIENAHEGVGETRLNECDEIKAALSISRERRPAWDKATLEALGFAAVDADETLSRRIYLEQDEAWNPVPMFVVRAEKPAL